MKKSRKVLLEILGVFLAMITVGLVWWNVSTPLVNIAPEKVSKIEFFYQGKTVVITDTNDIKHIIDNLNSVSFKKDKISLFHLGFSFKTTIYKSNGHVYKKFIIEAENTIRKDPFYYQSTSGSIDYNYIKGLFKNKTN